MFHKIIPSPMANLFVLLTSLTLSSQSLMAETPAPVKVPEITDLNADGLRARQKGVPILILFSMEGCAYCDIVREEFLKPMLRNRDYDSKVLIREIHSDSFASLRDFNGDRIDVDALAHRYNAGFSPTVVFLDYQGQPLAKSLVGITTRDYYGGFLDDAIDHSLQQIHKLALNQQRH